MRYRSRKITLRFTEEELAALDKKAKKAGLPRERFCRRVLNDTIVQEAPPAEFSELIRQVKRTGSNIDQLLKMARANGFLQLTELQLAIDHNLSTEQMLILVGSVKMADRLVREMMGL